MYSLYCFCVLFDYDCKMIVVVFFDMLCCWRFFLRFCKLLILIVCEEGVECCCEVVLRDSLVEVGILGCLLIGEGVL